VSARQHPVSELRLREYRCADGSWRPPRAEGLARVLAKAGYGARTRTEDLVRAGRVAVDGRVASDPATAVEPGQEIRLDGNLLCEAPRRYVAMSKPSGADCQARRGVGRSVHDYLPADAVGLEPAGRLDARARGLLLLSNDQWWNTRVAQDPTLERTYEVLVSGTVSTVELDVIRAGMILPSLGSFKPVRADVLAEEDQRTRLVMVLRGGQQRQIRPVLITLRHEVLWLVRTGIGAVTLKGLHPGQWRELTDAEVRQLARG